ncbi:MAG: hypothetical protein ACJ77B_08295 [Chloroflexota bacterium]
MVAAVLSSCSQSASPAASGALLFNGDAHVVVSGQEHGEFTVPLGRGGVLSGGSFMTAEYGAVQLGALTYQGPALVGDHRTARTESTVTSLMITLSLPDHNPPYDTYTSLAGECVVTVKEAGPSGGTATFSCAKVPNVDGTVLVDAQGTFDAHP